jgi:hypothetical protein
MVVARNTLDLGLLWVSESLLPQLASIPTLEQIGPPHPITFDAMGQLSLPEISFATH